MMEQGTVEETEVCLLTRQEGKVKAELVNGTPDVLASKRIAPSLLSSEHIEQYVLATGLISPFYKGGEKSRLKKASYEGRIGDTAYTFKDRKLEPVKLKDGRLKIGANSIVFIECDLDFRLPEYIALRFNLQIKHVHRGLLLGTGPIVDPGYWGKLCIPLHNLTNEDYYIEKDEGLIWIDFTKTTSKVIPALSQGRAPTTTGTWDIRKFIMKAAEGNGDGTIVAIQSSINQVVQTSRDAATAAQNSAKTAEKSASNAERRSRIAALGTLFGGSIGVIALIVGIATLIVNQNSFFVSQHQLYKDYVNNARSEVEDVSKKADAVRSLSSAIEKKLSAYDDLEQKLFQMQSQIQSLQKQNAQLSETLSAMQHANP